jgi:hypothetical protein
MPLLEIVQTTHVNATIRLEESTAIQVDQYAAFLHAPADEVVNKALAYVFSKDRDFQDFLRTPEAAHVQPTLRVRRLGQNGSASEPANVSAKPAKPADAVHDLRPRN